MRPLLSTKTSALVLIVVVASAICGASLSHFYTERGANRRSLNDSIVRVALNGQAIRAIRDGKTTEAIDLLNSMIDTDVLYLMRYDHLESNNADFTTRKSTVFTALRDDRAQYPRPDRAKAFEADPEWKRYRQELEDYIKNAVH